MTLLSPQDQERSYTHLGYGSIDGIPAGDLAELQRGFTKIRSDYQANVVSRILDACDYWFNLWLQPYGEMLSEINSKELIQGDINRSVLRTGNPEDLRKIVWESYLARVRELAQQLWVPNYRDEMNLRFRFERSGGDFINSIPGPADTAVGAAQFELLTNAGGVGIAVW